MKSLISFFDSLNDSLFTCSDNIFNKLFDNLEYNDEYPKVNVKETNSEYIIEIVNPGFTKDETSIKVQNRTLYVSMTSESKEGEGYKKYHCKQWNKSSYEETWNLPENVIEENISANSNDGVLTIIIPKKLNNNEANFRFINID